jgi:hypothetical protein
MLNVRDNVELKELSEDIDGDKTQGTGLLAIDVLAWYGGVGSAYKL